VSGGRRQAADSEIWLGRNTGGPGEETGDRRRDLAGEEHGQVAQRDVVGHGPGKPYSHAASKC
jgi:hypothetical protein